MSVDALKKITGVGKDAPIANKQPAQGFMPAGYVMPPGAIPMMGAHAVDTSSPELNPQQPQPFTQTFIYGYYNGLMNFFEPMITKDYLETKPDFTAEVKQPERFAKRGYYPTRYSIKYNAERKEYTVSLEGLVLHEASVAAPATKPAAGAKKQTARAISK
jgi:hypothetical protein